MAQTTFSGPVVSQNGFADNSFTTAERDAIVNPQAGLLIYNTDNNTYEVYNGTSFQPAFGGGPGPGSFPYTFTFAGKGQLAAKLYTIPPSGNAIQFINFSGAIQSTPMLTPWDTTTLDFASAVASTPLSTYAGGFNPWEGVAWNNDGTRLVAGMDNTGATNFWRFSFSNPYDVTSLYYAAPGFSVPGVVRGLTFGDNGNKLYGMSGGMIYQYQLPAPYDISSLVGSQSFNAYSVFGLANSTQQVSFNSAGTVGVLFQSGMFYTGEITQFQLNTPWDISTINTSTYVNTTLTDGQIVYVGTAGCVLKPDASKIIFGAYDPSYSTFAFQYTTS